jgi:phosphoserine aminotransferase
MTVTVYILEQIKLFNFTKQQGGVLKMQKQKHDMISQIHTLIDLSLINLKQVFQP